MKTDLEQLAAIAVCHIDEAPESRRADMLDAAAKIFRAEGSSKEADKLNAAAAIRREADRAQRQLSDLFKPEA